MCLDVAYDLDGQEMPSFISVSGHSKALFAVFAFLPRNALVLMLFQTDFHHEFNFG